MTKSEARSKSLRLRDALTRQERMHYSREIVKNLTSLPCYQNTEVLLAYANYRSEVETLELICQALSEGRQVFVPRVEGRNMEFYQITDLTQLQAGYRGIPEPISGRPYTDCLLQTKQIPQTLLCMPGVAFDRAHHRIGYGGGFYDRYLEKLAVYQKQGSLRLVTAALAYTCQIWDEISWESHDIMPDMILTQEGTI